MPAFPLPEPSPTPAKISRSTRDSARMIALGALHVAAAEVAYNPACFEAAYQYLLATAAVVTGDESTLGELAVGRGNLALKYGYWQRAKGEFSSVARSSKNTQRRAEGVQKLIAVGDWLVTHGDPVSACNLFMTACDDLDLMNGTGWAHQVPAAEADALRRTGLESLERTVPAALTALAARASSHERGAREQAGAMAMTLAEVTRSLGFPEDRLEDVQSRICIAVLTHAGDSRDGARAKEIATSRRDWLARAKGGTSL